MIQRTSGVLNIACKCFVDQNSGTILRDILIVLQKKKNNAQFLKTNFGCFCCIQTHDLKILKTWDIKYVKMYPIISQKSYSNPTTGSVSVCEVDSPALHPYLLWLDACVIFKILPTDLFIISPFPQPYLCNPFLLNSAMMYLLGVLR